MILSTLKAIAAVTVITAPSMRTSNSLQTGLDWGWSSFMQTHGVSMTPTSTLVATYSNYESDFNGLYDFSIGFVETQPRDNLQAFTLPAGKYLVFSGQGRHSSDYTRSMDAYLAVFSNKH